jgi:hypothetical protein
MDILKIMSISAVAIAIATCAFVFLMYRRVSQRLDGLSVAHLTLSRTLQHMVSASMPPQNTMPPASVTGSELVHDDEQRNIIIDEAVGVRRIPVSDDDSTENSVNDSEESEDDNDSDTDNDYESEASQATSVIRSLNIMESINDSDETMLPLELVASEDDEPNDNMGLESRIVELNVDASPINDTSSSVNSDEDLEDDSDDEDRNDEDEEANENADQPSKEQQEEADDVPQDIIPFSNAANSHHHQTDLKLQKVEALRKMALEMNLADEESLKKMKKPQLMNMLNGH